MAVWGKQEHSGDAQMCAGFDREELSQIEKGGIITDGKTWIYLNPMFRTSEMLPATARPAGPEIPRVPS